MGCTPYFYVNPLAGHPDLGVLALVLHPYALEATRMRKCMIALTALLAASSAWAVSPAMIPSGTQVTVRINETLDTRNTRTGDRFTAVLVTPLKTTNGVVIPAGTPFLGHVANSDDAGRLKGRAVLSLALDSFEFRGRTYAVSTGSNGAVSKSHKGRNKALIGGGAGVGAAVGAITGGLGGAAVGALVGGGAGTAGAAITGQKHVTIPSESVMSFQLTAPVQM